MNGVDQRPVTALAIARSGARLDELRAIYRSTRISKFAAIRQYWKLRVGVQVDRATIRVRSILDRTITRFGGLINLVIIPGAIVLVCGRQMGWSIGHGLAWYVVVMLLAAWVAVRLFFPADDELEDRFRRLQRALDPARSDRELTRHSCLLAAQALRAAELDHAELQKRFDQEINHLRVIDWTGMRGVVFEDFLAKIFREWGYLVRMTKVTGDQGVDLVVERDGLRVAIQAKGYPLSTVGNDAVQQAHTGMAFYECHVAAVITNSTFSASARELAAKVGCVLIDRDRIPDLIEGRILFS